MTIILKTHLREFKSKKFGVKRTYGRTECRTLYIIIILDLLDQLIGRQVRKKENVFIIIRLR